MAKWRMGQPASVSMNTVFPISIHSGKEYHRYYVYVMRVTQSKHSCCYTEPELEQPSQIKSNQ